MSCVTAEWYGFVPTNWSNLALEQVPILAAEHKPDLVVCKCSPSAWIKGESCTVVVAEVLIADAVLRVNVDEGRK